MKKQDAAPPASPPAVAVPRAPPHPIFNSSSPPLPLHPRPQKLSPIISPPLPTVVSVKIGGHPNKILSPSPLSTAPALIGGQRLLVLSSPSFPFAKMPIAGHKLIISLGPLLASSAPIGGQEQLISSPGPRSALTAPALVGALLFAIPTTLAPIECQQQLIQSRLRSMVGELVWPDDEVDPRRLPPNRK